MRPVVLVLEVVPQAQRERSAVRVDGDVSVETAQHLGLHAPVEAFDLPSPLRVAGCAVDEGDLEPAGKDRSGVVGDEACAVVGVAEIEETMAADTAVEPAKEELGGLVGADDDIEPTSRGVVEVEDGDAAEPMGAGPEHLAVEEEHLHSVGKLEAAHVAIAAPFRPAGVETHSLHRAPDGRAVDILDRCDDPALLGTSKELGDRGFAILLPLSPKEADELVVENQGRLCPLA